jgi:LEA14-like dessication related protein
MMLPGKVWLAVLIAPVPGCTPLGLWVYQDPEVTVSRVRVGVDSLSNAPLLVALDLENPNDYPLSTVKLELSLELDSLQVGELSRDSMVTLPEEGISTVALPLVPGEDISAGRLVRLGEGTHHFAVEGHAEFKTPFGKRRVRFAQEGDLKFGPSSPPSAPTDPNG